MMLWELLFSEVISFQCINALAQLVWELYIYIILFKQKKCKENTLTMDMGAG